jgi:hypothetical protein
MRRDDKQGAVRCTQHTTEKKKERKKTRLSVMLTKYGEKGNGCIFSPFTDNK